MLFQNVRNFLIRWATASSWRRTAFGTIRRRKLSIDTTSTTTC